MKIYFDDILINEDYYKSLTNTHNLFNGSFILGSTASNTFTLELDVLATSTTPEVIKITDNDEDYATLVIDKVEDVDKYTKSYKLTDKLVDLNYYYDASEFINQNGGSALTSEILADMCSKVGVEVDENINWINDIPVTWYDNTILAREYAGYIAEINAGYIFILPNGKLTIKQHKMTSKYTINVDDCENFTLGERHIISKVVYDNGIVKYEAGDDTGNTLYVDANNVFIVSQDQITKIYNSIVGFEFYSVETGNCPISKDVRAGDVITFVDGDNEYPTIANIDLSYNGGWNGGYSLDINTERQEETDTIGTNTKIKGIITRLNRDEAQLEVIATETDENSEKIGQLELDYEEINLKVSEITDFVKDVSNMGSITLENAAQNIINSLSIIGSISLLFGNDGQTYGAPVYFSDDLYFNDNLYFSTGVPLAEVLYPSSNLFGKNMNLIIEYQVTGEDGSITIQQDIIPLPFKYLNYMNSEIYDEFIVKNSIAKVIRRVGVNSDMQLYELPNEVVEELGELTINLHEGTNKIYMQCFTNAMLSAEYVTQNEFTDAFVTHSEFNAGLDITSTSIKQEVNAQIEGIDGEIQEINGSLELKLNTDDLTTEFNANVDKINLQGYTTVNEDFKINLDGTMEAKNGKFSGTVEASNIVGGTVEGTYISGGTINSSNITGNSLISIAASTGMPTVTMGLLANTNYGYIDISDAQGDLNINSNYIYTSGEIHCDGNSSIGENLDIFGNLTVFGTKNRAVKTKDNKVILLNAYETATPYFGDIGSNITDENGYCKIEIEDIFKETIELENYKVFIQECGDGKLYVKKHEDHFEVIGTPNLEFDWELKAIQKGYKDIRLKEAVIKGVEDEKNSNN